MALYRTFYRRKGCIVLLLLATTFWIAYLIISSPAGKDQRFPNVDVIYDSGFKAVKEQSVTRKYFPEAPEKSRKNPQDIVIQAPDVVLNSGSKNDVQKKVESHDTAREQENKAKEEKSEINKDNSGGKEQENKAKEDKSEVKKDNSGGQKEIPLEKKEVQVKTEEDVKKNEVIINKLANKTETNMTKPENLTKGPVVKDMGQKVMELGEKFRNKTIEVGENIKNKTIEKLADLGVIQKKKLIKLIFKKVKWNLNVSMADIGYIMKDTEFLKKKQNLTDMEYQPLSPNNSTFNLTKSKYGLGYCDCKDLTCLCCVRIQNKWLKVNNSACSMLNFVSKSQNKWLKVNNSACSMLNFVSKSQELQYEFRMDGTPIYKDTIAAEFPPKICLESDSAAAGACVLFSNVTSHIDIAAENHKIHLSGCMELALTLFNKTLSDFPVSCFKIPGDEKEHEDKANNFGNFMP